VVSESVIDAARPAVSAPSSQASRAFNARCG
jgi:hypothetical protein